VLAGPVEAAALGNVLVQARAMGADLPDLAAMRALVAETHDLTRFEPSGESDAWAAAETHLHADLSGGYGAGAPEAADNSRGGSR
jgi:rhamnulokinase